MTTPAETAQATTAILESGAIMLGAALVFVTLFRRLKLGATLGYIVAGALIGPAASRPDPRSRAAHQRHRNRHRAAAVHRRARASAEPVVAAAQGHLRPRSRAGRRCAGSRISAAALSRARHFAGSRAGDRSAARPFVDRAGAADAPLGQRAEHAAGRARLLDPAVPGPRDRSDDHDHRRDGAAQPGPGRAGRLDACALHRARGHRPGHRRTLGAQSAVPPRRPAWRARAVHRRGAVHRHRLGGGHALASSVGAARRVRRGRDARRIALPARAGERRRAVPLDPPRAVLPLGRNAARPSA